MPQQTTVHDVDLAWQLFAATRSRSYPAKKCVERVEAFEAAPQDFFIRQTFLCPAFENTIDSHRFDALKSRVVQVGVVNHFTHLRNGLIRDGKAFGKRLKCAAIAVMRKFRVQHVDGNCVWYALRARGEDEFCLGIDEFVDQPRRSHAIDFWPRTGQPASSTILFRVERPKFRRAPGPLSPTKQHCHIVSAGTVEEIDLTKLAKLLS